MLISGVPWCHQASPPHTLHHILHTCPVPAPGHTGLPSSPLLDRDWQTLQRRPVLAVITSVRSPAGFIIGKAVTSVFISTERFN